MDTSDRSAAQTVSAMYQAIRDKDVETAHDCFADDVEIHESPALPWGGVYHGKENFPKIVEQLGKYVDMNTLEIEEVVGDGDRAWGCLTWKVIGSDDRTTVAEQYAVRDGKIISARVFYYDPGQLPKV
jgi:ketosteroid isomerase-like protein